MANNRNTATIDKHSRAVVADLFLAAVPRCDRGAKNLARSEAGNPPAWLHRVHPSHLDALGYCGGLVFCNKCACISSSGYGATHLIKICKNKIPAGSEGR